MIIYIIGKSRQRIGVQLQEARDTFSEIAEKHADALKVFFIYYLMRCASFSACFIKASACFIEASANICNNKYIYNKK